MAKEVVHVPLMGDDDADLNEMTDEIHDQRLATALTRFWHRQLIEMDELDIGKLLGFLNLLYELRASDGYVRIQCLY